MGIMIFRGLRHYKNVDFYTVIYGAITRFEQGSDVIAFCFRMILFDATLKTHAVWTRVEAGRPVRKLL